MPLGFLMVAAGLATIIYSIHDRPRREWIMWGSGAIVIFIVGFIFLGSAYIHKVKSDLIKRGRPRYKIIEDEDEEE